MATQREKFEALRSLDEAMFRLDVLIPLLKKMGYKNVRETHGSGEYGKDITFRESTALGDRYHAVVAKKGDISGAASGKDNLAVVQNQINMAFETPIEDVESKGKYHVDRVIVWTTGKITDNAQHQIVSSLSNAYRNVDFKSGQATVELLEQYYPGYFTIHDPYVSEYYSAAKVFYSQLEELRTLGGSSEQHNLPVIFVPPMLSPFNGFSSKQKRTHSKQYLFDDLVNMSENVAVVGSAGSGKSTLLRRLLLRIIEENEQSMRRSPIPVLVEIKRLDLDDANSIEKSLNAQFTRFDSSGLSQELGTDLADGSVIALLDGLDELKTEERILRALMCVKEFMQKYPRIRVVLTSRLLDIFDRPDTLSVFRILQIESLTPDQMVTFAENWYGKGSDGATKLAKFIRDPMTLHGLPATPLTLALVAILYESGTKEVPANLTELFGKYIELALGRWDVSRDISLQFEWKVKEFVLRRISWDLHEQHKSEITCPDFKAAVERLGSERGLDLKADSFCEEITQRSELLLKTEDDEFEFKHRSFQEYFVGAEINSRSNALDIVVNHFLESWWSDAIFFAGGLRPDGHDYLRTILDKVGVSESGHLMFAINLGMLAQATYLAPKSIKKEAVERVLDSLTHAWAYFSENYSQVAKERKNKEVPAHLIFLGIHGAIAQFTLGSITLSPVLSEIVAENISRPSEKLSPRERAKTEWRLFFLASACVGVDNLADFVKLFQSGLIEDPGFLFWGKMLAEGASKQPWHTESDRANLHSLIKKLEQKIEKNRAYLAGLQKSGPIALPPPS